jgi:quinol monooxygenase YgiN
VIVVVGRVQTDAERRDALIQLAQEVARASRAEAGCLNYALYADPEDEHRFVIVEEWADEAALQEHFRTSHIEHFMRHFPGTLAAPPDVQFHTVERSRDLGSVAAR